MRVAYADPPYLGCCALYGHYHGDEGLCWDNIETHWLLMERLHHEYPDGWALSATSASLPQLLSRHQWEGLRVGAWVKPFAAFKVNVNPAYAWEPVIFMGGRKRSREEWSGRDWVSAMPPVFSGEARGAGLAGMKPQAFCWWLFTDIFGLTPDDDLVDLFEGSGAVRRAWDAYRRQHGLFVHSPLHGGREQGNNAGTDTALDL